MMEVSFIKTEVLFLISGPIVLPVLWQTGTCPLLFRLISPNGWKMSFRDVLFWKLPLFQVWSSRRVLTSTLSITIHSISQIPLSVLRSLPEVAQVVSTPVLSPGRGTILRLMIRRLVSITSIYLLDRKPIPTVMMNFLLPVRKWRYLICPNW